MWLGRHSGKSDDQIGRRKPWLRKPLWCDFREAEAQRSGRCSRDRGKRCRYGVNSTPLSKSGDFEGVIARFAPGSVIHLTTLRDGELFDRTITLGYARCPRGLSASNLAASQAADAFTSLKKPAKLFDAGQLTPGAPLLLSSIRHLIDQSARLKNEVNSTLLSIGELGDQINCTGMEFSGQWNNLAGTRVAPYTCDLGTKQLSIDATVTIKGPNGTVYDLVTPAAIENADTVVETHPVWRWLPKDH